MSLSLHNIAEATYKWALFNWLKEKFTSVPFSHSVMFNSSKPRGLQHARIPCPSPTPRAYSNWCLSQWWHPTVSSSVIPFSSCLQSLSALGIFPMSHSLHQVAKLLELSFSISPSNKYSGLMSFCIDWLHLLAVQGTLKTLLQQHNLQASILWCSAFFMVQLLHPYMTTEKYIA